MEETPITEVVNGFIVNVETGEVLGHIDTGDQFAVTDLKSAEWVLEKMQAQDSEIAGLGLRRQAIIDQLDSMVRDNKRRRDWLEYRFGNDLMAFADDALKDAKSKSLKTPYGTLGFRLNPGSIKVREEAKEYAVTWAKEHAPDAVKVTESILVTPLKGRTDLPADVFDVTEPRDVFYIKTGVGK